MAYIPACPTGSLDASDMWHIRGKINQLWSDNELKRDYRADVGTINAIRSEQNAELKPLLEDKSKWNCVLVEWMNQCDDTLEGCDDECDTTGGAEVTFENKEYALEDCESVKITVPERAFETSIHNWDEAVALQFMTKLTVLDNWLNATVIAALDGYVGANGYSHPIFIKDAGSEDICIPAAYWTPGLAAYLNLSAINNDQQNNYWIDGGRIYTMAFNAALDSTNPDGQSKVNRIEAAFGNRVYYDLRALDATTSKQTSYSINKGALAHAHRNRYSETPQSFSNGADLIRFSIASKNIPGVYYDAIYKTVCNSADSGVDHEWRVWSHASGLLLNPLSECQTASTGVLGYQCCQGVAA